MHTIKQRNIDDAASNAATIAQLKQLKTELCVLIHCFGTSFVACACLACYATRVV